MNKTAIFLAVSIIMALVLGAWHSLADFEDIDLSDALRDQQNIPYIKLSKGSVHYQLDQPDSQAASVSSELVVLVHGFSTPSYLWETTRKQLSSAGYHVLSFDLYGRGYSDRPNIDYSIDLFVDQLQELLAALNINEPLHLVGLSMGGPITTRFTHRHPERVRSLSLLAPLVMTPERLDLRLISTPGLGEFLSTVVMMPKIKHGNKTSMYDPGVYPEWHQRMDQHIHFKGYRQALLSTLRYLAGRSFERDYAELAKTRVPAQLIWGQQDQVVPLAQSEVIKGVFPVIPLHILDKTGHLPQIEQSEKVGELLLAHFRSVQGES